MSKVYKGVLEFSIVVEEDQSTLKYVCTCDIVKMTNVFDVYYVEQKDTVWYLDENGEWQPDTGSHYAGGSYPNITCNVICNHTLDEVVAWLSSISGDTYVWITPLTEVSSTPANQAA